MKPVVVSFPRAGRTWLLTSIGLVLCANDNTSFDQANLKRREKVDGTHDGTDKSKKVHYKDLSTDKSAYRDSKVILLIRDPRDITVSAFLHAKHRKGIFDGELSDYLRDPRFGIEKCIRFYNIWYDNQAVPKKFLPVFYEKLHQNFDNWLKIVCQFCEVPYSDQSITEAVRLSSIDNLRQWEKTGFLKRGTGKPKNVKNTDSYYHRKGKIGGYLDYMSKSDLKYADKALEEYKWRLITQ